MSRYPKIPEPVRQRIRAYYLDGLSYGFIAKRVGVSKGGVAGVLRKNRLPAAQAPSQPRKMA